MFQEIFERRAVKVESQRTDPVTLTELYHASQLSK